MQAENETQKKPSVYVFLGDDLDAMRSAEAKFCKELGNEEMANLNVATLQGKVDGLDVLANNVNLFPFGVERRLVIYRDALAQVRSQDDTERWQKIVSAVPPTTALVLEFDTSWVKRKKKWNWEIFNKHPWLEKWVRQETDWLYYKQFRIPSKSDMPAHVMKMVEQEGETIERAAALELANTMGDDILQLRQEVQKLCLYVHGERAITKADVHALSNSMPEEDVFAMVDAFALGDAQQALHHMRTMFGNQDQARVFSMVVRQFRLLLLTKEALQTGSADKVATTIHVHPYVAKKLVQQCRRFSFEGLKDIYRALYDLDGDIKRGYTTLEVGMEMIFFDRVGG